MIFSKRFLTILSILVACHIFFPPFAYAYLDPGTGSYIFQLLLAGILGLLFVVKAYWGKIKLFFTRIFSSDEENDKDA